MNAAHPAIVLDIRGMTCASCVSRVEKALRLVPGVTDAVVNLATETATVSGAGGVAASAVAAVSKAGYAASVHLTGDSRRHEFAPGQTWALIACALLAAPLWGVPAAPLGVVTLAERAQISAVPTATGATVFDGDTLSTDSVGILRVRAGAAQFSAGSGSRPVLAARRRARRRAPRAPSARRAG